jgi:hypothetical protein
MYDEFGQDRVKTSPALESRHLMKKCFLVAIAFLLLSGCSWSKAWKWIDEMDWERDDQTVRIVDFLIR